MFCIVPAEISEESIDQLAALAWWTAIWKLVLIHGCVAGDQNWFCLSKWRRHESLLFQVQDKATMLPSMWLQPTKPRLWTINSLLFHNMHCIFRDQIFTGLLRSGVRADWLSVATPRHISILSILKLLAQALFGLSLTFSSTVFSRTFSKLFTSIRSSCSNRLKRCSLMCLSISSASARSLNALLAILSRSVLSLIFSSSTFASYLLSSWPNLRFWDQMTLNSFHWWTSLSTW